MRFLMRCLLLCSTLALAGCGLFSDEDDPFDISIRESVPVSFSIDSAVLCPPSIGDCSDPDGAPDDLQAPDVELPPVPLDIIEATGNQELADAASRIKRVEIESVDYSYPNNTLNSEGPRVIMYLNGIQATDRNGGTEIVDLPGVNSEGTEDQGTIELADDVRDAASDRLKTLRFSMIPLLSPAAINRGDQYPSGETDVELELNLRFVVNPVDAL